MLLFLLFFLAFPLFSYEDMDKWPFCQELLSHYPPEKIRDDMVRDINLRLSTQETEYITRTIWHTDAGYHAVAMNRASRPAGGMSPRLSPEKMLQNPNYLDDIVLQSSFCIAATETLTNILEYLNGRFPYETIQMNLIQKDLFGTRDEYLNYLWNIRDENWHSIGTRHRSLVIHLMQAGLEDKKFFDFVAPRIRSSYPHYIPMLEFFQRSTGLNYETLRQALKHEDYEVFSWAVKKISSQHITELYEDLRLAINNLIGRSVRKVDRVFVSMLDSPEVQERTFIEGRGGNLRLFIQYRYLPFDHKVLIFDYEPGHFDLFPPFQLYPIPANPKIKEEYQIRKIEKLY